MDEFLKTCLIVCPFIFLAGFVDSIAGGGGLIAIPAYLLAGLPVSVASGTNKVVSSLGAMTASVKYFKNGSIRLRPTLFAAVLAFAGSAAGTKLATFFQEETLRALVLVALPCVAVFLAVKKDFGSESAMRAEVSPRREAVTAALIGLACGCYDGMVGPGTGTFLLMCFTAFLPMDLLTASGCSRVSNLSADVASAVVWALNGSVLWKLAVPAIVFGMLGNYFGARFAIRGGSRKIRGMVFLVLGLLFAKMLWDFFPK